MAGNLLILEYIFVQSYLMKVISPLILLWALIPLVIFSQSIRFYGNGVNAPDQDRIKIPLTATSPVNVSGNFTIEFWIKCQASNNNGTVSAASNGDGWITGNIIFDRDIYGNGDYGDFGLAIGSGSGLPSSYRVVAFGIDRSGNGITIRGNTHVADNQWHHIAITRNTSTGQIRLYVDGNQDASGTGPTGNVNYRIGRSTSYPNSDPFIVLGAEKHDAGAAYPSYNGLMDELRISNVIRYTSNFTPPTAPFTTDANTMGLYHFNENSGTTANDVSGASGGPSHGTLNVGGTPAGPVWSTDSPFGTLPVKWVDFKAEKQADKVILRWQVIQNGESGRFEAERSAGGTIYEKIGEIPAQFHCADPCHYVFTDQRPVKGKNVYRIKYISSLNHTEYSKSVSLYLESRDDYRIIASGNTVLLISEERVDELIVWGSDGKRLLEFRSLPAGAYRWAIKYSGVLFVHIRLSDGRFRTHRLILQ
ncbi:MAG: LamG domain-containing protein [Chitinophagaceae bacterium]|nr:LamG domain-containing protein [Chitinophagaceae bacterium]